MIGRFKSTYCNHPLDAAPMDISLKVNNLGNEGLTTFLKNIDTMTSPKLDTDADCLKLI